MLMSEETRDSLNVLLKETFQLNSFCDNIAYNLDFYSYSLTSGVVHHSVAHEFPVLADSISEFMIKMDARPSRMSLVDNDKDYSANLIEIFKDMVDNFINYRQKIIQLIQVAEFNDDFEVKIFLEDYLLSFIPFLKQANVWLVEANRYKDDFKSFDARIESFTTFIPVLKNEGDKSDE